jgi:hypothetical protein
MQGRFQRSVFVGRGVVLVEWSGCDFRAARVPLEGGSVNSDLSRLLTALLIVAKDGLKERGDFGPFAALVRTDSDTLSFAQREKSSDDPEKVMESIEDW